LLFALAFAPWRSSFCATGCGLVARSDTVLAAAGRSLLAIAIALVLMADPVFTGDWLALLITTGFCTDGKAPIAAGADRETEASTDTAAVVAVLAAAAAEAPFEGEVEVEVPAEATTTVALDAPAA
jgi:hypothetical protein